MYNRFVTQDDLRDALEEVFSPADVGLIMSSPVRDDLRTFQFNFFYKDYLFNGGQTVLREEIALAKAFAKSGIFSLAVAFPH